MAGWPTWLQQLTIILNLQSNIRKHGVFCYDLDPFLHYKDIFLWLLKKPLISHLGLNEYFN